ncbi:exopolyphosphatase [Evansella tamaricis]|uniref:Exopolyphosphatase n=1 Tax=Evansella tamaricis TaxID=2069301 RepID=A0ABS6JEI8_9BACI|nr:exopolyphosphatase [Evansella tamaricis]MBU9712090.1 exopolyphosphatase [Evansella tamaricis]
MKKQQIGIIDMGSNSVRFVIYDINEHGGIKEIQNLKVVARLSSHINKNGEMTKTGIKEIGKVLERFETIAKNYSLTTVRCVATAAIRNATNQKEILKAIKGKSIFSIDVLSEKEEAYYGYLAVTNSMNIEDGITIDIGGGSTEVTLFEHRKLKNYHSFPFGAITLKKQFISTDQPTEEEMQRLTSFLFEQFNSLTWVKNQGLPVIGIGGTARNLALIHQRQILYPLAGLHQYEMSIDDINSVSQGLLRLNLEERRQVEGLSKDRADIIIPAIKAIEELIRFSGSDKFIVSDKGLRNGLFSEMYLQPIGITQFPNVAEESFYQLSLDYSMDNEHQKQISILALFMAKELNPYLESPLTKYDLLLLRWAARIFYIGASIHPESKSQHTFYLLTNQSVDGLTHKERFVLALLASFKSRSQLKQYASPFPGWLLKEESSKLEVMGAILRLCWALDYSHRGVILSVKLERKDDSTYVLHFGYSGDPFFEETYGKKHKKHLEKALGKQIEFVFEKNNLF